MTPSTRRTTDLLVGTVLAVGLCLTLAGCTDEAEEPVVERAANVVQPGAPGEGSRRLDPTETVVVEPAPHTPADVAFMQQMIGHHAQALVMTSLVDERSDNESLELFVERMDLSQEAEIELMQDWLEERDEDVPAWDPVFGATGGHPDGMDMGDDELMPGMATQEQLDELAAAEGEAFDRLFIELMTAHHLGAITMVRELYDEGGGDEQAVFTLASHIESDQAIEIDRMQQMLADLDA